MTRTVSTAERQSSAAKAQGWSRAPGRSGARLRQLQRFARRQRGIPTDRPLPQVTSAYAGTPFLSSSASPMRSPSGPRM